MFAAFKKLASKPDASASNGPPNSAGIPMTGSLQKKFSKGVQYNMKIIIKGDRNVGKSCLLERLQGKGFVETYTPSEEIQVASIQWSFKATEDIVKVEVWDVVDRGKARARQTGLKLTSKTSVPDTPALDAEFLDVYKGTHGVILMLDITKNWTFEYACKELPKIPNDIPVLLLGNHCDMGHHRVITSEQAIGLIEGLGQRTAEVMYGESSMRNGFGLRLLHKFLGLPFLRLQKETLLASLERNQRDTEVCGFELTEFLNSKESDYNEFLDNLVHKRRQIADSNPKNFTHFSGNSASSSSIAQPTNSIPFPSAKSIIIGAGQPIIVPGQRNVTNEIAAVRNSIATTKPLSAPLSIAAHISTTSTTTLSTTTSSSHINGADHHDLNRLFINEQKVVSVEEFCPDGETLDKNFLDDLPLGVSQIRQMESIDSDSDTNEIGNPLVAKFHEDPTDDLPMPLPLPLQSNQPTDHQLLPPKINPLAKGKYKNNIQVNLSMGSIPKRRTSISSDDIEMPTIMKSVCDSNSSGGLSNEEFDSWLSDTNQRRSPEGGEDVTSLPSIDKNSFNHDNNGGTEDKHSLDDSLSTHTKEKKQKSKKKKSKKEKHEKEDKVKEKKKTRRPKESELEDFLTGNKLNSDDGNPLPIDAAYEAL